MSPAILGCFGLAALAAAGLAAWEPRRADPLIDLRFFRSVPFAGATVIAICAFAALGGFLLLNTLYLQDVRGLSALDAGLYTLPVGAMIIVFAPLSGRITGKRGARVPMVAAGAALAAGAAALAGLTPTTPVAWLIAAYVVFGVGNGLVNPPITYTAVSGMPRAQAGVAAGVASTSRQVGQSLGVAVAGSVVTSSLHAPFRSGFTPASHASWWIIVGWGVAVLLAGLASTGRWARATAARTAAALLSDEAKVPAASR